MPWYLRKLMARGGYMDQANDGTSGSTGGSGGASGTTGGTGGEGGSGSAGGGASGTGGTGGGEGGDPDAARKLADEKAALLKEVMSKKDKIKELDTTVQTLNEKLKQFEGIDAPAVRKLLEEKAEAERKQLEAKGDFDSLRKQMVEVHEAEKKTLADQLAATSGTVAELQTQIANLTVGNAFGTSSFIKDELILTPTKARVVYGSHFEFKDGQVVGYDKPAGSANRVMLVDGKGDPLAFDAALEKIVEADADKETVKKAKGRQGSGSGSVQAPKGGQAPTTGTLSARDKIAAGLAVSFKK